VIALLLIAAFQDKEHFPLEKGMRWTYAVGDAETEMTIKGKAKVGEIECVKVETASGAASSTEFFSVDDKGVMLRKIESWQNETLGEREPEPAIPRLKFGTKKGESWEWKGAVAGQAQSAKYVNEGEEEIEVPAGKYTCLRIRTVAEAAGGKYTIDRWFAKGVGMVKTVVKMGEREQKTELKKFEKP